MQGPVFWFKKEFRQTGEKNVYKVAVMLYNYTNAELV